MICIYNSFSQFLYTYSLCYMEHHMTIGTYRDKILNWINDIFFSDFADGNNMMYVNFISVFRSIYFAEIETTHLARNAAIAFHIIIFAYFFCLWIALVGVYCYCSLCPFYNVIGFLLNLSYFDGLGKVVISLVLFSSYTINMLTKGVQKSSHLQSPFFFVRGL